MCIDVRKTCECGKQSVQFHLRDNILGPEVIARLNCPDCTDKNIELNQENILNDNDWRIEYELDVAKTLLANKLEIDPDQVTPAFIFDNGYCCWQEMYPGEQEEIKEEKKQIVKLLHEDCKKYLSTIQKWNINRIEQLKQEGWRKAQNDR